MSVQELTKMKKTIESLSKDAQIGLYKLLDKCPDVIINENQNGSFINLSGIKGDSLKLVREYLKYQEEQRTCIAELDERKKQLEDRYFQSKRKPITQPYSSDECEASLTTE